MTKNILVIAGAGGFGRETFHWAQDQINLGQAGFSIIKFIDDRNDFAAYPEVAAGLISSIEAYSPHPDHQVVIALSGNTARRDLAHRLTSQGAQFGSVIHPSAVIARNSVALPGLIMCPNSLISTHTYIGEHAHINVGASIGHDCQIGNFVTISSHADIMGSCTIEDEVFLGSGGRILPKCRVAAGSRIGASAQVQRSVRKKSTFYQINTKRM